MLIFLISGGQPRDKKKTLPVVAGLLLFLIQACGPAPEPDLPPVEIDFRRTDSLMWACAQALQAAEPMAPEEAYARYLQPDRDFWYEWLGVDQIMPEATPPQADSFMTRQLSQLLSDPAMLTLLDTVRLAFPYDYPLAERIEPPLRRLVAAFDSLELPAFRTHVNGYVPSGDPRTVDQLLPSPHYFSFGLHYFLGPEFAFYPPTLPAYIRRRFDPRYLELMMVREIAEGMVPPVDLSRQPTLLDHMVQAGIKQYFVRQLLPETPDSVRLFYTEDQMYWADYYEERIYKELIPHLYEIDFKLMRDYLSDKPFTSNLSNESAPRLGEYCGTRIVEAYMARHPEEGLADLVERTDYDAIFRESRYKP
ncbi:MAG: hypothetical protein D6722_01440 [Bacteroidetes bacterium]|nr:MAG: hypothetical protein D6722_01440 [Bacteroidota bacterium]